MQVPKIIRRITPSLTSEWISDHLNDPDFLYNTVKVCSRCAGKLTYGPSGKRNGPRVPESLSQMSFYLDVDGDEQGSLIGKQYPVRKPSSIEDKPQMIGDAKLTENTPRYAVDQSPFAADRELQRMEDPTYSLTGYRPLQMGNEVEGRVLRKAVKAREGMEQNQEGSSRLSNGHVETGADLETVAEDVPEAAPEAVPEPCPPLKSWRQNSKRRGVQRGRPRGGVYEPVKLPSTRGLKEGILGRPSEQMVVDPELLHKLKQQPPQPPPGAFNFRPPRLPAGSSLRHHREKVRTFNIEDAGLFMNAGMHANEEDPDEREAAQLEEQARQLILEASRRRTERAARPPSGRSAATSRASHASRRSNDMKGDSAHRGVGSRASSGSRTAR